MKKLLFLVLSVASLSADPSAIYTVPNKNIDGVTKVEAQPRIGVSKQEQTLIDRVKTSISSAESGQSKLSRDVLDIHGMSSAKVRHFLNNLCSAQNTCYLEIGCWKGSTLVSALYKNPQVKAYAIDDMSQFEGPLEEFKANCNRFLSQASLSFFCQDCFSVDPMTFISDKVNVYFYDGNHHGDDQRDAYLFYDSVLDDSFITAVDDWNWEQVRRGTYEAFDKLGYTVLYEVSLPADRNGDWAQWWNGLYVAVIRK